MNVLNKLTGSKSCLAMISFASTIAFADSPAASTPVTPTVSAPVVSVTNNPTPTETKTVTPEASSSQNTTTTTPTADNKEAPKAPPEDLLPEQFKVYYDKNLGISKKSFKTSTEKVIPNNNEYGEGKGCYISCYSKQSKDAIYAVDPDVYLMGQIRVEGHYHNGLCLPKGFEDKDIRTAKEFKAKCEEAFPERCEKESCWATGNTGNWY